MRCSIVIPVYGQAALTRQCLDILLAQRHGEIEVEVVVVDDCSKDETPELLAGYGKAIRVVTHQVNKGFAAAVNDGAAVASGDALVFLNNDTIPQPGWLEALVDYATAHPSAGLVGAKLLFPDDTIQHAGVVFDQTGFAKHIYAGFPAWHPAVNRSRAFQAVTAACMFVRRPLFEQLGGLDTAFRNCYEDVDFCLRAGLAGAEVHYCAKSVLYHLESMSEGRFEDVATNERIYVNRWIGRVHPDDFRYYIEDGLISVAYDYGFPLRISLAAELGVIESDGHELSASRLLGLRSHRASEMTREITRLTAGLAGVERATGPGGRLRPVAEGAARWLSPNPGQGLVSVLVPANNDEERMRELLPRIFGQEGNAIVEVVAVDCGSSDGTLDVLRELDVTILSLDSPFAELSLPELARHARGEVLVFLGPQAMPADEHWLGTLLSALDGDAAIAAVCSRLLPCDGADPLTRRALLEGELSSIAGGPIEDVAAFHWSSTAIRAELLRRIPLPTATDAAVHAWATAVLGSGLALVRESRSLVYLDSPSVLDLVERGVAEGRAEPDRGRDGLDRVLVGALEQALEDARRLERDPRLVGEELEQLQLEAAFRRLTHAAGRAVGRAAGTALGERAWIEDAASVPRNGSEPEA